MRTLSPDTITCQNPQCSYFMKNDGKHIVKWGKTRNGHQKYLCCQCNKTFLETRNTFLYKKQFNENNLNKIYQLLIEKHSIRSIERITGHHRDTIRALLRAMSKNPKNTELIIFNSIKICKKDIDALWHTIQCSEKKRGGPLCAEGTSPGLISKATTVTRGYDNTFLPATKTLESKRISA